MRFDKNTLLPKYQKKLSTSSPQEISEAKIEDVREFIDNAFDVGGKGFLERCKKYGTNEKGYPLRVDPWFAEALEILGDIRVSEVLTSGCSQQGKTLANTLAYADILVSGQMNVGWFYASREALNANVPEQFRPVVDNWVANYEKATGKKLSRPDDRGTNTRYQVNKATAIFSYSSTSKTTQSREGLAKVGGAAASFTCNYLVIEEASQHPPQARDVLPRRLDASLIASRPIRMLGTPGSGQGIEREYPNADYHFYPHYHCPNCGDISPLDPKGSLLKEIDITDSLGRAKKSFYGASGRPAKWFCHDENNAVETAYIACQSCHEELDEATRIAAHFRCIKSGISLREFLDSLPKGIPDKRYKCVIVFSPLVRRSKTNLAKEIISDGLNCSDPTDFQQQRLGHPSEIAVSGLTLEILERCINAPRVVPIHERYIPKVITTAGIDVGRSSDFIQVVRYHLPLDYRSKGSVAISESTLREVLYGSDINRNDIPEILDRFDVDFALIDNEPDRETAAKLCYEVGDRLAMADQRKEITEIIKKSSVIDGGNEYDCWFIRPNKFKNVLLDSFLIQAEGGYPLYRLPSEWQRWISNGSERSPLRHLCSPTKDPVKGWIRASDHNDDLFFALMFAEAAFYIMLQDVDDGSWVGMS